MKDDYWMIQEARGYATFDGWLNAILKDRNDTFYDSTTGKIIRQYIANAKQNGFQGWHDVFKKAHTFKQREKKRGVSNDRKQAGKIASAGL